MILRQSLRRQQRNCLKVAGVFWIPTYFKKQHEQHSWELNCIDVYQSVHFPAPQSSSRNAEEGEQDLRELESKLIDFALEKSTEPTAPPHPAIDRKHSFQICHFSSCQACSYWPSFAADCIAVEYREPPFWCTVAYYEFSQRVGEYFQATGYTVTVDGFTDPSAGTGGHFCLGLLSNINRQPFAVETRRLIGKQFYFKIWKLHCCFPSSSFPNFF